LAILVAGIGVRDTAVLPVLLGGAQLCRNGQTEAQDGGEGRGDGAMAVGHGCSSANVHGTVPPRKMKTLSHRELE